MVISELYGYKDHNHYQTFKSLMKNSSDLVSRITNLDQFSTYLEKNGFVRLGSGAFGAVFTNSALDYCIKVFPKDPAYLHFVNICLKHQNNQHFPKFRGRMMSLGDQQYAVRMEVLSDDFTNEELQFISLLRKLSRPNVKSLSLVLSDKKQFSKDAMNYCLDEAISVYENQKTLIDTLILIDENRDRFGLDLHKGNFMKRENTLVITDPYAG